MKIVVALLLMLFVSIVVGSEREADLHVKSCEALGLIAVKYQVLETREYVVNCYTQAEYMEHWRQRNEPGQEFIVKEN